MAMEAMPEPKLRKNASSLLFDVTSMLNVSGRGDGSLASIRHSTRNQLARKSKTQINIGLGFSKMNKDIRADSDNEGGAPDKSVGELEKGEKRPPVIVEEIKGDLLMGLDAKELEYEDNGTIASGANPSSGHSGKSEQDEITLVKRRDSSGSEAFSLPLEANVLIVDDQMFLADAIQMILEDLGLRSEKAISGAQAISMVRQRY